MFLRKKKPELKIISSAKSAKIPLFKRKPVKVVVSIILLLIVGCIAFVGYIAANGKKVFQSGLGGSSLIKTLYGQEQIKGEDTGRVNILFAGMGGANHPGGELTDSMILASFDVKNNKLALVSIPRDLYVPIAGKKISGKINEAYADGEKDKKGTGADTMKQTVETVTGVSIDYSIVVDFSGFVKIVDELGGIDINVDKAIYDPYYPDAQMIGYSPFKISAGMHHMDGELALKYARSRHTSSDFDRAGRQQKILEAIKEKAAAEGLLKNPKKILDMATIIGDHFRTDLTPAEMKRVIEIVQGLDRANITTKVLTDSSDGLLVSSTLDGRYILKPKKGNFTDIQSLVKNIFGTENSTVVSAKVEVINASRVAGVASKVAQSLQTVTGIEIVNVGTAKAVASSSVIYDHTGGSNAAALEAIKQQFGAQVSPSTTATTSLDQSADFSIVVGTDYQSIK